MQAEQFLCWSGMIDTEHSTTSSSNEEDREKSQNEGKHLSSGYLWFWVKWRSNTI